MKKLSRVILIGIITAAMFVCGCTPTVPTATVAGTPGASDKPSQEITDTPSQEVTDTPSQEITDTPSQEITNTPSQEITGTPSQEITDTPSQGITSTPSLEVTPSAPSGLVIPKLPQSADKSYFSTVAVDALGRVTSSISGEREGKYVGIFYWVWNGQHNGGGIYDITKLLKESPEDLWNVNGTSKSPLYQFHFWGEPLYGYYHSEDEWVLRRHLEMMTEAGVDFMAIDLSNGVVYPSPIKKLMSLIQEYREQGFDCPQITFFTHIDSKGVVESLYNDIYSKNHAPLSWWCPYEDKKPYMIAYPDPDTEGMVTGSGVVRGKFSKEISDFFHFKAPQWPDEEFVADAFPWIDWGRYEQKEHTNVISVSPAIGPGAPMSHALLWHDPYYGKIWGRGWNGVSNNKNDIQKGTLFQSQWDYAIKNDPEIVFIDGFNEWIAQKNIMNPDIAPEVYFADAVDMEFSRDTEPMKGGYGDNFLMQMMANVRAFKGIGDKTLYTVFEGDWSRAASYSDFGSDNSSRNYKAAWGRTVYKQAAGRVNIQNVWMAHDREALHLVVKCQNDIGELTDASHMNIFIGTGTPSLKGWEGYEYVINRSGAGSIDKLGKDFSLSRSGSCEIKIEGNVMYVVIPLESLGITSNNFSVYFKLADSVEHPSDIMDYYVSGQSFPMGRISLSYNGAR